MNNGPMKTSMLSSHISALRNLQTVNSMQIIEERALIARDSPNMQNIYQYYTAVYNFFISIPILAKVATFKERFFKYRDMYLGLRHNIYDDLNLVTRRNMNTLLEMVDAMYFLIQMTLHEEYNYTFRTQEKRKAGLNQIEEFINDNIFTSKKGVKKDVRQDSIPGMVEEEY